MCLHILIPYFTYVQNSTADFGNFSSLKSVRKREDNIICTNVSAFSPTFQAFTPQKSAIASTDSVVQRYVYLCGWSHNMRLYILYEQV